MRALVTGGAGLIGSHIVDELLAAGRDEADLVTLRLHELPPGADADRCRQLRRELGLGADPEAPAFVTGDGTPLAVADLPRFLRFARLVARSLEGNAALCRGLLKTRYDLREPEEVAA
jgi:NAD(P)-dependent dehydrogenase (short-subunit alcohol dehydrogenase family)